MFHSENVCSSVYIFLVNIMADLMRYIQCSKGRISNYRPVIWFWCWNILTIPASSYWTYIWDYRSFRLASIKFVVGIVPTFFWWYSTQIFCNRLISILFAVCRICIFYYFSWVFEISSKTTRILDLKIAIKSNYL